MTLGWHAWACSEQLAQSVEAVQGLFANCALDADESRINFVSTKKHHIAEANTFGKLDGVYRAWRKHRLLEENRGIRSALRMIRR